MNAHRLLFAIALAMACCATAASAGGFNLAWNDCWGGGGVANKAFACNTNVGSSVLVFSFDPPQVIPTVIGGSAVIDLETASSPAPSWWQLGTGGCREGALHVQFNAPSPACVDTWSGAATGTLSYQMNFGGDTKRARIEVSWWLPEALAAQVEPGTEYFAFSLILDKASSVGLGSCPGCLDPGCFALTAIWLYQPVGMATYPICNPRDALFATWQGGAVAGGCPGTDGPPWTPGDCLATPAIRRSWGLVKSLYR